MTMTSSFMSIVASPASFTVVMLSPLGDVVGYRFQFRLAFAPVIFCSPVAREFLHRPKRHALRCIVDQFSFGPLGRVYAPAQLGKFCVWEIELKRTKRSF